MNVINVPSKYYISDQLSYYSATFKYNLLWCYLIHFESNNRNGL